MGLTIQPNAVERRRSVRTFGYQPLSAETIAIIQAAFSDPDFNRGPFGNSFEFHYIPLEDADIAGQKRLGSYGHINAAQGYLTAGCPNERLALLDYGFVFQRYILGLTSLGLGTCWLGGAYDRRFFTEAIGLDKSLILPAVTPVGYSADTRSPDELGRRVMSTARRKDWEEVFFIGDFNTRLPWENSGPLRSAFEKTHLVPSAFNKRPCRMVCSEDQKQVHLYLFRTPHFNDGQFYDVQLLDCGVNMSHFSLGASLDGVQGSWQVADPGLQLPEEGVEYVASFVVA